MGKKCYWIQLGKFTTDSNKYNASTQSNWFDGPPKPNHNFDKALKQLLLYIQFICTMYERKQFDNDTIEMKIFYTQFNQKTSMTDKNKESIPQEISNNPKQNNGQEKEYNTECSLRNDHDRK